MRRRPPNSRRLTEIPLEPFSRKASSRRRATSRAGTAGELVRIVDPDDQTLAEVKEPNAR
jgi:hypothetical protein